MKLSHISFIIFAFLLSSCVSTKNTVQNNTSTNKAPKVQQSESPENKNTSATVKTKTTKATNHKTITEITETEVPKTTAVFNHNSFNNLLQKHVSNEGRVNYKNIQKERSVLTNYIKSLGDNMPNDSWTKADKLAYWINAYNAMTIDLILRHYPIESIKDIKDPWKQRHWKLADKWYNLDEIEHQIIRKMGEPRIHFALVCAAVSCPKLYNKAFTGSTLEDDLTKLTRAFLADTSKNNISENSIKVSKIFSWFTKDFKQDGTLIDFLNKYSDVEISKNAKKQFNTYHWNLNE